MIYWLFLVASVIVASFSQVLLKKSAAKKYDNVIKEYLNPYVIIGYMMMVGTTVLTILAYRGIEYKNGPVIESIIYIEGSNHLVKNSADKNQKKKIRSSEHGWGMKILDDIAQQYNGRLEYGFKDGIYSTMVSLVYTNDQEEGI